LRGGRRPASEAFEPQIGRGDDQIVLDVEPDLPLEGCASGLIGKGYPSGVGADGQHIRFLIQHDQDRGAGAGFQYAVARKNCEPIGIGRGGPGDGFRTGIGEDIFPRGGGEGSAGQAGWIPGRGWRGRQVIQDDLIHPDGV